MSLLVMVRGPNSFVNVVYLRRTWENILLTSMITNKGNQSDDKNKKKTREESFAKCKQYFKRILKGHVIDSPIVLLFVH